MCWDVEGEEIDLEAQRRELERLEQARHDRLLAEELQHDMAGGAREGERDAPPSCREDEQLATTSSSVGSSPPGSSSSGNNPGVTTEIAPPSANPPAPRECWGGPPSDSHDTLQFRASDIVRPPPSPSSHVTNHSPSSQSSPNSHLPVDTHPVCSRSLLLSDQRLAEQLQEQERAERERFRQLSESQGQRDAELARALQEEEGGEGVAVDDGALALALQQREAELLKSDEQLAHVNPAKRIREEEKGAVDDGALALALQQREAELLKNDEQLAQTLQQEAAVDDSEADVHLAQSLHKEEEEFQRRLEQDEQLAQALQSSESAQDTSRDEELAKQIAAQFEATPLNSAEAAAASSTTQSRDLLSRPPNWWTVCPNCPPEANRRFHLVEINPGENEWVSITSPLEGAGFRPTRLQRVQNLKLYQRLQFEKETMKMDRGEDDDFTVNERVLYHTSSASVKVICGEGLDQRLSRKGRFGNGVYFRCTPLYILVYS